MNSARKYVITGGTHTGKSSIAVELHKKGYTIVPDAGWEVIVDLNKEMGMQKQKEWRTNNPKEFYSLIAHKQEELESTIKENEVVFYDRGILDYFGFCMLVDIDPPQKLQELSEKIEYDLVFYCEALDEFSDREESGRSLNSEQSMKLAEFIRGIYCGGYKTIDIPKDSIENRVSIILDSINYS